MFPVAGIETVAGGDTGSEPDKGKKGAERWQKMRENVIKEWQAEQEKKGANTEVKQPQSIGGHASNSSTPAKEAQPNKSVVASANANKEDHKEEKDAQHGNRTMQKLKEKLSRH